MSDVLRAYSDFPTEVLAHGLMEATYSHTGVLEQRHILGPQERFGRSYKTALEWALKGQRLHDGGWQGKFAVMGEDGNIVGDASISPSIRLRKLHVPVPPVLASPILADEEGYVGYYPHVQAWSVEDGEVLQGAYRELAVLAKQPRYRRATERARTPQVAPAWTLEPESSPEFIHNAIQHAGFFSHKVGRFDGAESHWRIPPRSELYLLHESRSPFYPNQ